MAEGPSATLYFKLLFSLHFIYIIFISLQICLQLNFVISLKCEFEAFMKKILLIIFLTFSLSVQADVRVNHDKKTFNLYTSSPTENNFYSIIYMFDIRVFF